MISEFEDSLHINWRQQRASVYDDTSQVYECKVLTVPAVMGSDKEITTRCLVGRYCISVEKFVSISGAVHLR